MGSIYRRGGKLWLAYKNRNGEREWRPSGFSVGQEKQARDLLDLIERQVAAAETINGAPASGPVTVEAYATRWIDRRRKHQSREAQDEDGNVRLRIIPALGSMLLDDVRPRHVRDWVLAMRETSTAPRTIINAYGTLRRMFRDARLDDLIEANPCELPAGVLPKREDKDPEWRAAAVFTRGEVEQLISDPRIPLGRRVLHGLKALAALRHGEAAGLRWEHYDADAQPLGALTIANSYLRKGTKTGVTRRMPVHPALAALLAEWKLSGWADAHGRKPRPADLIVPSAILTPQEAQKAADRFLADLTALGMRTKAGTRNRGGHDLRSTFITLAAEDGAVPDIIERATHAPRSTVRAGYQRFSWPAICAEVAKLRIELRKAGNVIALPLRLAAGAEGDGPPVHVEPLRRAAVTVGVTVGDNDAESKARKCETPRHHAGGPSSRRVGRPSSLTRPR